MICCDNCLDGNHKDCKKYLSVYGEFDYSCDCECQDEKEK